MKLEFGNKHDVTHDKLKRTQLFENRKLQQIYNINDVINIVTNIILCRHII